MQNTVYCRSCKAPIDPADTFCKACGVDQRTRSFPDPTLSIPPQQSATIDYAQSRNRLILSVAGVFVVLLVLGWFIQSAILRRKNGDQQDVQPAKQQTAHQDSQQKPNMPEPSANRVAEDDTAQIKAEAQSVIPQFMATTYEQNTQVSDVRVDVSRSSPTQAMAVLDFIVHWESGVTCQLQVDLRKYDSGWKAERFKRTGGVRLKDDGAEWHVDPNGHSVHSPDPDNPG